MSTITYITAEGIHVKHGDTVVVAPLPERIELDEDGNLPEGVELTEAEIADALAYIPPPDLAPLYRQLWESCDRYARSQTDDNSRTSINLIATNPEATQQQLLRAGAWAQWWSNLWVVYAIKKATLTATGTMPATDFATEVGAAPYTIWEIAAE